MKTVATEPKVKKLVKLTVKSLDADAADAFEYSAQGETFDDAARGLIFELQLALDEAPKEIYEGLWKLVSSDETTYVFQDFGTPEDNFRLTRSEVEKEPKHKSKFKLLTDGKEDGAQENDGRQIVVFGESNALAATGAGSVFTPEQIEFIKEHDSSFEFEGAMPIFTKRDVYRINMLHGSRFRSQEGLEVISGPMCEHWEDGAARVHIGKWKAGLYYVREAQDKRKVAEILFAYRSGKTTYIVSMSEWLDDIDKAFVLDPAKLTQGFDFARRTAPEQTKYDDGSGWKSWHSDNTSRHYWTTKRVPILTLVNDGWQFNEKCYPTSKFPKATEKAAVEFRETGSKRDVYHLVSNGAGDYLFWKGQSYFRREGKIEVLIKSRDGAVTPHTFKFHRDKGDDRGATDRMFCDGKEIDPTFEHYILSSR